MSETYQLPRGYLSASALGTLLRCPKQFEFRYIYDYVSPPSAALAMGKAAHSTYEKYYEDALSSTGPRLTPKQVSDLSVECLDSELKESELSMSDPEYDSAVIDIQDITSSYVEHIGGNITPILVEEQFRYITNCGVELMGYLDLRFDLGEGLVGLADYKITSKKWTLAKLASSLQFNLYSLATGLSHIEIHNMVKGPRTKVLPKKSSEDGVTDYTNKLRVIQHEFDGSEHIHFEEMVESAAKLITSGVFMPCDPEAWCCNETWCGYWDRCRGRAQVYRAAS